MNNIEERILTRAKLAVIDFINPDALEVAVSEHYDFMANKMAVRMIARLYEEEISDEYSAAVTYPSSWWDAFKEQYFPGWLRARFPVEYDAKTMRLRVSAVYPHYKPIDDLGPHVIRHTVNIK